MLCAQTDPLQEMLELSYTTVYECMSLPEVHLWCSRLQTSRCFAATSGTTSPTWKSYSSRRYGHPVPAVLICHS